MANVKEDNAKEAAKEIMKLLVAGAYRLELTTDHYIILRKQYGFKNSYGDLEDSYELLISIKEQISD